MGLKRIKQTINAICSFERANLDDKDFAADIEDYCISTKAGYFWGFCRNLQMRNTNKSAKKATT